MTNEDVFYLQWHITNRCLNRCSHCYQSTYSDHIELSVKDACTIIKDFVGACNLLSATPQLALTGGDPLLHPNFFDILDLCNNEIKDITIMGNPESILHNFDKFLNSYKQSKFKVQVSLDGNEQVHDNNRCLGSFDNTISAIKKLVSHEIPVLVMTTVSVFNMGNIQKLIEYITELGVSRWSFSRFVPNSGSNSITSDQYKKFIDKIHTILSDIKISYSNKEPLFSVQQGCAEKCTSYNGCSLGYSSLALLPDKSVMACRKFKDSCLGYWSERNNFLELFINNPKMSSYREAKNYGKCERCKYFDFCRGCRAAAFAATDSFSGDDPQCWR